MALVARSYLLIKPKEVTFVQLIRLLFSSRLKNISFIECSEEEGEKLRDTWFNLVLCASALLQSLLETYREQILKLGNAIETLLNLITANGGIFQLLKNILTWKVVPVPKLSPKLIGNLDTRKKLDDKIKPGDQKYMGALTMMAAKLAYEKAEFVSHVVEHDWKMKFVIFYTFWNAFYERNTTPVFLCQDSETNANLVIVAFRGTDPFDADGWSTDIDLAHYKIAGIGRVHRGFFRALGLKLKGEEDNIDKVSAYDGLVDKLVETLNQNPNAEFFVTGHSLGGALALLFAAGLAMHKDDGDQNAAFLLSKIGGVFTYGQPRVGDGNFGKYLADRFDLYKVKYNRYVYCNDVVPRIPFDDDSFEYKHFGKCYYFNRDYNGEVREEVPNKNYYSREEIIPKFVNAVMELRRSFTIQKEKGEEYAEGGLQKLFRVIGLFSPGLSAHGPQDYVNLTRLGSISALSVPDHSVKIFIP